MLAKQADTVMLFYLFSHEQLRHLFERLGYEFGPETARKNIDYYDARTSHGSTLSFVTHRMCWSSPWTMSTSTRWPKAAGSEGRLIAADHARRGEIATDDLRIVAARAGFELELHSDGVCSS